VGLAEKWGQCRRYYGEDIEWTGIGGGEFKPML
jgi:hypothetical protein